MAREKSRNHLTLGSLVFIFLAFFAPLNADANSNQKVKTNNFGLPGIIDLPTAKRLPDGEIVLTQQLQKYLARSSISFQALPRLGLSFRYSGHGKGGNEAYGRINHDRSFDAHISLFDEKNYLPEISIGLRDFIGSGWYSSEYIVGTKSIANLELTAGLGFGRLAGRNSISNPLGILSSRFDSREAEVGVDLGGTLGNLNWFQGNAAAFYGLRYQLGDKTTFIAEYTPDLMELESAYMDIESPWNLGVSYQINDYVDLSAHYLHGNQVSFAANVAANPERPPFLGGKELAPVPMRKRGQNSLPQFNNNENIIRRVLKADRFEIHHLKFEGDTVSIAVSNTKFRSIAQAVGRVASTLQRFASDNVKFANISFFAQGFQTATFRVDLEKITNEQFNPMGSMSETSSIVAIDAGAPQFIKSDHRFSWGIGPYFEQRLFNPQAPLGMETGIEIEAGLQLARGLKISTALRKSMLTNLTDNVQTSFSDLPKVQTDWPLYDVEGQDGHIHSLTISYFRNLASGLYGRAQVGLLEPFFAGISGELLYKPAQWPIGISVDIHHVRKRDFDMLFDLLDYETTLGHISLYYDVGGMFDIEVNAGRYLAGDWGATTTISRKFGSGWEVGGYATMTDVPFVTFGEGSFDKAIYFTIPIDWIVSSPRRSKRRLTLRPITRDGGANLASSRVLYKKIEGSQNASFKREFGRLWK